MDGPVIHPNYHPMNTLSNSSAALSLRSIDLLATNGYKSKFNERLIQFKRDYDFIGPFILFFLFAIISLPLFDYSYWLGTGIFITLVVGVYLHNQLISKKSTINIDSENQRIEVKNRFGTNWFLFEEVDSVFIKSKYNGTFTSADKQTNEEYDVTVGVTLKQGKNLNLFFYKSDFSEPTKEIIEVHDYLKSVLSR